MLLIIINIIIIDKVCLLSIIWIIMIKTWVISDTDYRHINF